MSVTYAEKKRSAAAANKAEAVPQPSIDELRAGTAAPTQEQLGHRVDLPDAMREKMENAFGADLSAVKLYESETVKDAGAAAVAQGSDIAFAPGMLDFTSFEGQARLGHELSHVVSQARGEVTGSGFLNDHSLEARADREGAMAAAGQQISAPTEAMSPVSAASASGPMQAAKMSGKVDRLKTINEQYGIDPSAVSQEDMDWYDAQMSNMDPQTMKAIQRAQTKASKSIVSRYRKNRRHGMDKNEASTRAHFSDAADDAQGYQSLLFNYAMQYDQTAGAFMGQYNNSLSRRDRAIRAKANKISNRATDAANNPFYASQAGTDLRTAEQVAREDRVRSRYRNLR